MNTRPLGLTGARVHPVGFGCMSLSGFYGPSSEAEAMRVLAAALDLGVDFWDTANVYGDGLSETRIGKFFAEAKGRREKVTLATKFSISRTPDGKRFIDNSEAHMIEALDGSLKRLGVGHVDLYYVHRLDPRFPIEETVGALSRQVEKGKIRAIGLSEMAPDTLRRAHVVHRIAAMQSEYSLWVRFPELGMLQTCAELGVAFVAFSPVGRGALSACAISTHCRRATFARTTRASSAKTGGAISSGSTPMSRWRNRSNATLASSPSPGRWRKASMC